LPNLGPEFDDERLRETLAEYVGVGADAGQPDADRFLRSVQSVVRKRIEILDGGDLPAIFLLNQSGEAPAGARRMGMIDYGDKPLEGQIWYAGPQLGFARALDHGCGYDDVALFDMVTDVLGQGAAPAVLFLPRVSRTLVRYYPFGVASEDAYEVLSVKAHRVQLHEVLAALDRVHANQLIVPHIQSVANKMWLDGERFRPVRNAELVAQSYVEGALWARFSHCRVRVEVSETSGRYDVALFGQDYSDGALLTPCYAVLELKVLRAFGEGGARVTDAFNKNWVRKGMQQAFAYAQDLTADAKALCCFDMRETDTGDQCFAHIAADASALNVILKKWHLYGRLADYRDMLTARGLAVSAGQDN